MKQPDFSIFPALETERLALRRLSLDDAEEILELRSDAKVAVLTGKAPFVSIDEAFAYINKIDNLINKNESIFWAISYKDAPALIGAVCLWNFDIPSRTVEIGYELLEKFQRKGFMGEVIVCVLRYAFYEMGVETVVAFPSSDNPPSVKLLEKLGFELAPDDYKHTHVNVPGMLTYIHSNPG
jgi:ribosomal-protein-alanine N-acetyltransferase